MTQSYWRSLEQIEGRPESQAFLEREFPKGASELPEGVTRRDMMKLLAVSAPAVYLPSAFAQTNDPNAAAAGAAPEAPIAPSVAT